MWRGWRRLAGLVWLVTWMGILYLVASPWRHLGGVVEERLRWLEWFVLFTGLGFGFTLGRAGRFVARANGLLTHLRFLRWLVYPLAALTAIVLVALTLMGERGAVGVVVTAFLAYWAGIDVAFGAVPLLDGKPYALRRQLPPDPDRRAGAPASDPLTEWVPPWERF